jgi:predicted nucleic acid-binding protein
MTTVGLDSSALIAWITQSPGWKQIQRLIDHPDVDLVLPGVVLAESIYISRAKGNVSTPAQIAATLSAVGMTVVPPQADDLIRAGELVESSRRHPGPMDFAIGREVTLSLGDALILAVTERLGCTIVTRDRYRSTAAADGVTTAVIAQLPTT